MLRAKTFLSKVFQETVLVTEKKRSLHSKTCMKGPPGIPNSL